jgi:hypothetical protein
MPMNPDLCVDTVDLREAASALLATAARIAAAATPPPSPPPTPRWSSVDAAIATASAAQVELARLATDLAETARETTATAEAYEDADARAAARLRQSR